MSVWQRLFAGKRNYTSAPVSGSPDAANKEIPIIQDQLRQLRSTIEQLIRDTKVSIPTAARAVPEGTSRGLPPQSDFGAILKSIERSVGTLVDQSRSVTNRSPQPVVTNEYLERKFSELSRNQSTAVRSAADDASIAIKQAVVNSLANTPSESALVPEWHKMLLSKIGELERLVEQGERDRGELRQKHAAEMEAQAQRFELLMKEASATWENERSAINRRHTEEQEQQRRASENDRNSLLSEHAAEKSNILASHEIDLLALQQALTAEQGKVWPDFLMDDELKEFRDAVKASFHGGDTAGMRLYGEMLALSSCRDAPQDFCDQVVALGLALYNWTNRNAVPASGQKWDEVVALWATGKIKQYGLEVVSVRVGETFNMALHNSAEMNGDIVKQVKSFLIRAPAGNAKSKAVVVLA